MSRVAVTIAVVIDNDDSINKIVLCFSGTSRNAVMIYLTEISPKDVRGSVGTTSPFIFNLGVLLGQVLGLPEILGQVGVVNMRGK